MYQSLLLLARHLKNKDFFTGANGESNLKEKKKELILTIVMHSGVKGMAKVINTHPKLVFSV
jgi:hypothetical protein